MPIRVETDAVIYVPAIEPGSEAAANIAIRFPIDDSGDIIVETGRYGRQVSISTLREALEKAEECLEKASR